MLKLGFLYNGGIIYIPMRSMGPPAGGLALRAKPCEFGYAKRVLLSKPKGFDGAGVRGF